MNTPVNKSWINEPLLRIALHIFFWLISFYIFLYIFKIGNKPGKIDYVYTALFNAFIIPAVYINLILLLPQLRRSNFWIGYVLLNIFSIILFSWLNLKFFSSWSNRLLPEYFFISYFNFFQISLFFIAYLGITSLLKLSKSWFIVNTLQKELLMIEKEKAAREKDLIELEAKALRAQMNPHFIFNCLNSIKSLVQENKNEAGVIYLTTFSKLIRGLFNNADKKLISLYDEIETCNHYLQLESMRFDSKFSFAVCVEPDIDLKSVEVPALIIQPFIENAIWHGIVPKNCGGHVTLSVSKMNNRVAVKIDDDGIGREASMQNKSARGLTHLSKGMHLTQSRLELNNLLQQKEAKLEITDKKEGCVALGTSVVLTFKVD
jgi:sensor histidine kinase YesM